MLEWKDPKRNRLRNLEVLKVQDHDLPEELPDNLFENLGSLTTLNLSHNHIPGPIPVSVAKLTNLEKVILNDNAFSKSLPDDIVLESLKELHLQNNLFTGNIPPTLGNLSLESFDASYYAFSGPLPDFSGWSSLREKLDFSNNNFTGPLLDYFGSLRELKVFRASNNQLSGGIPPSISALDSLEEMDLSGNNLQGNVTAGMCSNVENVTIAISVDCDKVGCECCTAC